MPAFNAQSIKLPGKQDQRNILAQFDVILIVTLVCSIVTAVKGIVTCLSRRCVKTYAQIK